MNDSDLKKLQQVELDILRIVTELCEREGIQYFLMDGTMLGAVRHKGFIPWDDDVDIGMPRPDYDRFVGIAKSLLPEHLDIQNYQYPGTYDRLNTRVINESVKLYHSSYTTAERMEPSWIDVFPLDGMPKNRIVFQAHKFHYLVVRLFYHFSCFDRTVNLTRTDRTKLQKVLIWFGKTFKVFRNLDTKKILNKLETLLRKYDYTTSKYIVNAHSSYMFKETYAKEWFGDGQYIGFEECQMRVPSDYDKALTHLYGDYMTPPPKGQEEKHQILRIKFGEQA